MAFDPALTRKWLPVDMYIGGNEHAVLHLMYTRFITMVLHDLRLIDFDEPFKRFRAHGIITHEGSKMSKSRPNVINPDSYIEQHGADTFRAYLMFMGPYTEGGDFRDAGIGGVRRFLERVWRYVTRTTFEDSPSKDSRPADRPPQDPHLLSTVHTKIRKVTQDIEALRYNTAIAALMELLTALQAQPRHDRWAARVLLQMLSPFAPFLAQELWQRLGEPGMVHDAPWPAYDEAMVRSEQVDIVVQVDGKTRGQLTVPAGASQNDVQQLAQANPRIQSYLTGRAVARTIFLPDRLINLVTS